MSNALLETLTSEIKNSKSVGPVTLGGASLLLLRLVSKLDRHIFLQVENHSIASDLFAYCFMLNKESFCFFPEDDSGFTVPGFNTENQRYRKETVLKRDQAIACCVIGVSQAFDKKTIPLTKNSKIEKLTYKKEQEIDRDQVLDKLLEFGYSKVDTTREPGFFSSRGDILDVFPYHFKNPFRLSFDFDKIERISIYDPSSQVSIKDVSSLVLHEHIEAQNVDNITLMEHYLHPDVLSLNASGDFFSIGKKHSKQQFQTGFRRLSMKNISQKDRLSRIKDVARKYDTVVFVGISAAPTFEGLLFDELERGYIPSSYFSDKFSILYVSESDLLNKDRFLNRWSYKKHWIQQESVSSVLNLNVGGFIVHRLFGIGVFMGIVESKKNNKECVGIEYADNACVYVSLDQLSLVHKYVGSKKEPKISTLGTKKWRLGVEKTKEEIEIVANEIIENYKKNTQNRSFKYETENSLYGEPNSSFPYVETPDQAKAISEVLSDLDAEKPMDRLVCGDVGFGKTEVAVRAIFKVFLSKKLSVFLCPTTILSDQHFRTLTKRLSSLGVSIEQLTRFVSKKKQKEIIQKLNNNELDLLIGTHRILSEDVSIINLGLLIIDEEHRFGVKHKEQIRFIKESVDVLTLTATPIPRTLQQSMVGIKKISTILTPPESRKPIITTIQYFNWKLIKRKIKNETVRGGQVYFLHNNTFTMPLIVDKLRKSFSHLSIVGLSGQMKNNEIENRSNLFFDGKIDVLVCTTIIESGIDVPNANCIIINDSQNFGLSQLYQIRGRVGRGNVQAYCTLLVPDKKLEKSAFEKLKALEQNTSLGSGHKLSLKDLEIRGAGSIFGYKQSGHIASVGYQMYCDLLAEELTKKRASEKQSYKPTKITCSVATEIPPSYIENPSIRLSYYHKISSVVNLLSVDQLEGELIDVFGQFTYEVNNLLNLARVKLLYSISEISKIIISEREVSIVIYANEKTRESRSVVANILAYSSEGVEGVYLKDPTEESVRVLFILKKGLNPISFLIEIVDLFSYKNIT